MSNIKNIDSAFNVFKNTFKFCDFLNEKNIHCENIIDIKLTLIPEKANKLVKKSYFDGESMIEYYYNYIGPGSITMTLLVDTITPHLQAFYMFTYVLDYLKRFLILTGYELYDFCSVKLKVLSTEDSEESIYDFYIDEEYEDEILEKSNYWIWNNELNRYIVN